MARCAVAVAAALLFVAVAGAAAAQRNGPPPAAGKKAAKGDPALVERGAYLAQVGGCADCHTPVRLDRELGVLVPDESRAWSGHPAGAPKPKGKPAAGDAGVIGGTFTAFTLPFGTVYAANLTPHETGLGGWTEEQFVQALRTGMHRGMAKGRPILPPMPWMNVARATDEDLRALYAFFMSVPPVENAVPPPEVTPDTWETYEAAWRKLAPNPKQNGQRKKAPTPRGSGR